MMELLSTTWSILCESALFIMLGFAIAGLLDALLLGERAIPLLGGNRPRSVVLAALIGVPLPLCSCSVLPTAVALRRKGAGKGATLSFLISTPETSVTSILLTYALLGPFMAIIRPIAASLTALVAGLVETGVEARWPAGGESAAEQAGGSATAGDEDPSCCCQRPEEAPERVSRWGRGMRFAFVDLFDDIFGWILIGIVAAAAIQVWLPPEVLNRVLGGEVQSMLLMVLIGVPLYVCAEGSTPIAAVLIAHGVNPGAALVFLLVGPATNIGSVGVLRNLLGMRTVVIYLTSIIVIALLMGGLTNYLLGGSAPELQARVLAEPLVPGWLKAAFAIAFLAVGALSIGRARYAERFSAWLDARLSLRMSANGLKVLALIVVVVGYAASGLYVVRAGEIGVVRRFGAIVRSDAGPGLHYAWPWPIDVADRVPVDLVRRSVIGFQRTAAGGLTDLADPRQSWHLVGDENEADIKTAVHWGVAHGQVVRFQYGIQDRETLVRNVALAAIRETLAGVSINSVFTADRRPCEEAIKRLIQQRLDAYSSGIRVASFHVLDAHAPPDVHAAFRDVASALEDRATRVHEARAEEARLVPAARGQAAWQRSEADGYAARTAALARGAADRFLALLDVFREHPDVTAARLEFEMLDYVLPRLRKYLKPPESEDGELDIWFVKPGVGAEVPTELPR